MFTGKKSDSVTYWNNYTKFWLYSWMTIYECYCSIVFTVVFLATLTAVNPCKLYWWLSCWNNWYKTSVNSKMPRKNVSPAFVTISMELSAFGQRLWPLQASNSVYSKPYLPFKVEAGFKSKQLRDVFICIIKINIDGNNFHIFVHFDRILISLQYNSLVCTIKSDT